MSPTVPGPSYQIFYQENNIAQYYRFTIPEQSNIRDRDGKLLTEVILYAQDEETALEKCSEYMTKWKGL